MLSNVEITQLCEMEPTAEELRNWLRDVLAQTQTDPTNLARKSGVAPSTLLRFLRGDGSLSFRTAAKLAHATGAKLPMVAEQQPQPQPLAGFSEIEGTPFELDRSAKPKTRLEQAIHALIGGRVAADPWLLSSNTLEDAGYLPGMIVIVDLNAQPDRGDVVCAQLYRWEEGTAETIFRLYEPPFLLAATREARYRKPLFVDNDRVVIKGVVTEALRVRAGPLQTKEETSK